MALANTIDPETGEDLSGQSVFNNPKVIRALFLAYNAIDKSVKRENGDGATEVDVVIVEDNKITASYQSLMNAGKRIPSFIQQLTGIYDAMILKAPPASEVMQVCGGYPFCSAQRVI